MASIKIRNVGSVSILSICGTIDINASNIIEAVGWLVNNGRRNILLDLTSVKKVDHSGLSILAIAYKNIVNHKGTIKFIGVSPDEKELFSLVRLDVEPFNRTNHTVDRARSLPCDIEHDHRSVAHE